MKFVLILGVLATFVAAKIDNKWVVYYPKDFDKSELCRVLNCRHHDACLVQENNAMCVRVEKLHEISGVKIDHRTGLDVDKAVNQATKHINRLKPYDADKYSKKFAEYKKKLAEKRKDKLAETEKFTNEVHVPIKHKKHPKHKHEHTPRHKETEKHDECSLKELKNMGGRLLQWFSDVHSESTEQAPPVLPRHQISCREDVGWMFEQWDGDRDGELSLEELNPLEGDKYEHCIKPFLDRCDDNGDDVISIDEWCDCFLWVGYEREEPPCHKAKHASDPHKLGSFIPRCDVDGYYRAEQCHEHYCFCVDRWGREFDQSRVEGKRPDCGQYAQPEEEDDEDFSEGSGKSQREL